MLCAKQHLLAGMLDEIVWKNFDRAVRVRRALPAGRPVKYDNETTVTHIPGCHEIAHAFGLVFGLEVVDGEHAYIASSKLLPAGGSKEPIIEVHSRMVKHSWIRLGLPDECEFILDVYNSEGFSIFPAVLAAPNPAYYVPDEVHHRAIMRNVRASKSFQDGLEYYTREIRRIAEEQRLLDTPA